MDSRERFLSIMRFQKPDRGQLWEMGYWAETLRRWYGEGLSEKRGLPAGLLPGDGLRGEAAPHNESSKTRFRERDVHDAMHFDEGILCLPINSCPNPPFEPIVYEESEHYKVYQDEYGIKKRMNKVEASIPEFLDWQVRSREDFQRLKEERFQPGLSARVPRDWREILERLRRRDFPLSIGGPPVGMYGFLRYMMGEERLLLNFYDDPALVRDMMSFFTDFWIALWEEALAQVTVDCAHFWEDMAYRSGPLISPAMFREFLMPCYRRITGFLKARGIEVILVDCDGNLDRLVPLFLESGLTGIYPIEMQAGNDLQGMRKSYPRLHLLGGVDKMQLSRGRGAIERELAKVPALIEAGGYIPFVDHMVHPEVSWADFSYYRGRIREMADAG